MLIDASSVDFPTPIEPSDSKTTVNASHFHDAHRECTDRLDSTASAVNPVSTHADVNGGRATKKPRFSSLEFETEARQLEAAVQHSSFLELPLEILAEILLQTVSPADLLSVARTCKALCAQLLSPGTQFIWKKMRAVVGLPEPGVYHADIADAGGKVVMGVRGVQRFLGREVAYAAFVFDGGLCENCGQYTDKMYASYSVNLRVCSSPICIVQIQAKFQQQYNDSDKWSSERALAWRRIPVVESVAIFPDHSGHWPFEGRMARLSLLNEETQRELEYEPAEVEKPRYNLRSAKDKPEKIKVPRELTKVSMFKLACAMARNCVWMQFCIDLFNWKNLWLRTNEAIKNSNEIRSRQFARAEGWNYADMLNHTSYGRFFKFSLVDRKYIKDEDHIRLRPTIARELHTFQQTRDHKTILKLRQRNLQDIWKYYQKLASQRQKSHSILPPFPVFLELPAVKMLQLPDLSKSKISVKSAVKDQSFMNIMIKDQITRWVEEAKRDLLATLELTGEGNKVHAEWEWDEMAPARRVPHPVLRPNAWWRCKICDSVDSRCAVDKCLDFDGVCRHQCKEKDGKKRKKGMTSRPWSAGNFVKDEQACAVMTTCLERLGVTDQPWDEATIKVHETMWFCRSCDPPLLVHGGNLPGHSHRHEIPMTIELATEEDLDTEPKPTEYGLVHWMIHCKVEVVKKWISKANYGCQHCHNISKSEDSDLAPAALVPTRADNDSPDAERKPSEKENKFDFNGLRCHLKSKHKIHKIRDEDFYCYKPVADFPATMDAMLQEGLQELVDAVLDLMSA
ncbi:hypothetical protein P691DRAFT_777987 [Macrolepiota fuliginosa MF-IS2]|uniref:F-box domain-containing protein n=1 Tax=Macrolepiota fuliginosa MF-IS2 TaxID=1400762 RepID=A0A9P6BZ04_9AGAR|nr:hypothetical protein P691DRAFT_777987 [Macrolepiota fuliginosa MF-IS2]